MLNLVNFAYHQNSMFYELWYVTEPEKLINPSPTPTTWAF